MKKVFSMNWHPPGSDGKRAVMYFETKELCAKFIADWDKAASLLGWEHAEKFRSECLEIDVQGA